MKYISKLPLGFLSALLLISLVEWRFSRDDLSFIELAELCWRVSGWAAEHESRGCDVLCLGDSQVKESIIPGELERRIGKRAYNLAVVGGNATSTYFLLRKALAAGAHPETVLVDFSPVNLEGDLKIRDRHWAELLDLWECAELAWASQDASAFGELALMKLLPSVAARKAIRADITAALNSASANRSDVTIPFWKNWNRNRGAMILLENPYNSGPMKKVSPTDWFAYVPPRTNPMNAFFLEKTLDLAASRGISVHWILPPLDPFVQEFREREGHEGIHVSLVETELRRHPNLFVIDARHAGYEWQAMWDRYHLNWRGALSLTAEISSILASTDDRSRWKLAKPYRTTRGEAHVDRVDFIALMRPAARR